MRVVTLLVAASLTSFGTAAASSQTCTDFEVRTGVCYSAGIDGDEAYTTGSEAHQDASGSSGSPSGGPTSTNPEGANSEGNVSANCPIGTWGCQMRDDYEVVVVTLSDIARFRPSPGIQRMEPDGWVVVGLPANIYSIVDRQIVPGELLGQSADVRFTPVAWHWSYGDGATATLATKGGTWAALGLDEFDATPTSHVYERAGSYTIRLSISFRAEYRIAGGPFVPIVGTITLPANELHITASGAKTVLVDRDCTIAPRGPGC